MPSTKTTPATHTTPTPPATANPAPKTTIRQYLVNAGIGIKDALRVFAYNGENPAMATIDEFIDWLAQPAFMDWVKPGARYLLPNGRTGTIAEVRDYDVVVRPDDIGASCTEVMSCDFTHIHQRHAVELQLNCELPNWFKPDAWVYDTVNCTMRMVLSTYPKLTFTTCGNGTLTLDRIYENVNRFKSVVIV